MSIPFRVSPSVYSQFTGLVIFKDTLSVPVTYLVWFALSAP